MLKKRVLTALLILPLIIGILYLPDWYFASAIAVIIGLGVWEFTKLIGLNSSWQRIFYLIIFFGLLYPTYLLPLNLVLFIAFIWWLITFYLVASYPDADIKFYSSRLLRALSGWLIFIPFWLAVKALHTVGLYYLVMVLCLVWVMDIGSFFAGKSFGRHKLAPRVSPGKTVEGAVGGLIFAGIVVLVFNRFSGVGYNLWWQWLLVALVTVVFSVVGDLFESVLKRIAGAKDSSNLLPGHGGVFDRIDSLTAAVPVFTLGLLLFLQNWK
jgi:phosphatidate cytidylyltransferase